MSQQYEGADFTWNEHQVDDIQPLQVWVMDFDEPARTDVIYVEPAAPASQDQEIAFCWNGLEFHIPVAPEPAAEQAGWAHQQPVSQDSWGIEEVFI